MKAVPLALATLALLALSACAGSPVPLIPPTSAASQSQLSDTDTATEAPAGASTTDNPATGVTSRGIGSPECEAATSALEATTDFENLVDEGAVTQADFDEAFTGGSINDLPADALPAFAATKAAAAKLVGLSAEQTTTAAADLAVAAGNFARVTEKICF